jgi:ring-1,2-phenylacetyl-CoA epoxidase subunit PaaE
MAVHFHPLYIKNIRRETADCVTVSFIIPNELKEVYQFVQGQNITLKTIVNGEELRRTYSICTAPFENELAVAIKKVNGGKFSTYANEKLQKGTSILVLPPTGKFNSKLDASNRKNYLAFAAGSGITPIISIIKTTLQTEPKSSFTLVYSNRTRSSIIFFEELEGLKNKYLDRFNLINLFSREKTDNEICFGRINNEKLEALGKLINYTSVDDCFICGPEAMIFCVKDFLEKKGLDNKKIHFELFVTQGQHTNKSLSTHLQQNVDETKSNIIIKVDGRSLDFTLGFKDKSILDAALSHGADLPFACKGGVCCTCKAKLLEGKVKMDVNWGLEQDEIEQGFILTCQSHPVSEKVVIDFDMRI